MIVSLIITVKNEAHTLPRLLDSIAAQTRPPDEIVIADGGSTDETLAVLRAYQKHLPIQIISQPGANISQGRNLAIRQARGDVIFSTDAGTRLDERWVEELIKPIDHRPSATDSAGSAMVGDQSSAVDVVAGFFIPDPTGAFETALAATTLPALGDIRPEKFMPSSRSVAFRKSAWEQVGGYPEWLDFCEDLVFDFALRDAGFRFAFAPRAVAYFRPRENLRAFFKQYYQYARGDGKANLFFKRHLIRYGTYWVALPLCIVLFILGFSLLAGGLLVLGFLAMFSTPYKRLVPLARHLSFDRKIIALIGIPVIRVTGDVAKMLGYPVGVVWRAKRAGTPQANRA